MRALYELRDKTWREKDENKKYCFGSRVSWKKVLDPDTGYGVLKGKTELETKIKYEGFRRKGGKDIKSLSEFNDYIRDGGKVGNANMGAGPKRRANLG